MAAEITTIEKQMKKAFEEDNFETFFKLLTDNANIGFVVNQVFTDEKLTPLHIATMNGYDDLVVLLLKNNEIDINANTKDGHTPLHIAAYNGHQEIVKVLLEKGANYEDEDKDGSTPLKIAAERGHKEILKLLQTHSSRNVPQQEEHTTPLYSRG